MVSAFGAYQYKVCLSDLRFVADVLCGSVLVMKYEYMVLYDGHDSDNEIDGHQQILNSYGQKGWDLVKVAFPVPTLCGPTSFVYFFKRAL